METTIKKNKGGRPKKVPKKRGRKKGQTKMALHPEVIQKLREVFLLDYTIEEACDHAEISPTTYYLELKRNLNFAHEMERAQRGLMKAAKRNIAKEIVKHENAQMSLAFLRHRQPERYRTKVEGDPSMFGNITIIQPTGIHPRIDPE